MKLVKGLEGFYEPDMGVVPSDVQVSIQSYLDSALRAAQKGDAAEKKFQKENKSDPANGFMKKYPQFTGMMYDALTSKTSSNSKKSESANNKKASSEKVETKEVEVSSALVVEAAVTTTPVPEEKKFTKNITPAVSYKHLLEKNKTEPQPVQEKIIETNDKGTPIHFLEELKIYELTHINNIGKFFSNIDHFIRNGIDERGPFAGVINDKFLKTLQSIKRDNFELLAEMFEHRRTVMGITIDEHTGEYLMKDGSKTGGFVRS